MPINFDISVGPHIKIKEDSRYLMRAVIVALLPAIIAATYFFGLKALYLILFTTLISILSEVIFQKIAKKPITVSDGSAAVTGILLALILPPTFPLWMAGVGAICAIVLVKGVFGGLGFNIFNPALAARAILLASWPVAMTTWIRPFDAVSTATPLFLAKIGQVVPGYLDLFIGNRAGSLGETSALALLIGAAYLLWKKVIDWPAPLAYISTVFILMFFFGKDPFFHVLSGGLIIGAFFMATDYVTTPVTAKGRFIFGLGCGIMTVLIRLFGGFPEGVNYSILLMNILTPMIDKYVRPKVYGKNN